MTQTQAQFSEILRLRSLPATLTNIEVRDMLRSLQNSARSPAIGIGWGVEAGAPDHDIMGLPRKERVDAGAYQSGATDWLPLPHGGINGAWDKELQGVKNVRKGVPNAAQ